MITLCLTALLSWKVWTFAPDLSWSFTPDLSGMSLEQRRSYLDSIAQGPGEHKERK